MVAIDMYIMLTYRGWRCLNLNTGLIEMLKLIRLFLRCNTMEYKFKGISESTVSMDNKELNYVANTLHGYWTFAINVFLSSLSLNIFGFGQKNIRACRMPYSAR